jgi:xanthine dehydrogenase accessory factor
LIDCSVFAGGEEMEATEFYERVLAVSQKGNPFVIATVVEAVGSTPRRSGSKMVILADGSTFDTIGGGKIEHQIIEDALDCLKHGASRMVEYALRPVGDHALGMLCGGETKVFLDVQMPGKTLVIVGAGHISQKLSPMAKLLDFRVIVLDSRSEFATQERFPDADQIICEHPARTAEVIPLGDNSHVVIVTHGHLNDKDALRSVIGSPARYIGMIGSRQKVRAVLAELAEEGIDAALLSRVHTPIGLNLGGQAPAEIAVSILAEIIAESYGRLDGLRPPVTNTGNSDANACQADEK